MKIPLFQILDHLTFFEYFFILGKNKIKPVKQNGKATDLRVDELEKIFGFPHHYTDVGLKDSERLKLLGKSFCVQAFKSLLEPLLFYEHH